jgi:hypothetical protein
MRLLDVRLAHGYRNYSAHEAPWCLPKPSPQVYRYTVCTWYLLMWARAMALFTVCVRGFMISTRIQSARIQCAGTWGHGSKSSVHTESSYRTVDTNTVYRYLYCMVVWKVKVISQLFKYKIILLLPVKLYTPLQNNISKRVNGFFFKSAYNALVASRADVPINYRPMNNSEDVKLHTKQLFPPIA